MISQYASLSAIGTFAVMGIILTASALDAGARERSRAGSFQGPEGRTAQWSKQVDRSAHSRSASSTWETARGTSSRWNHRTRDPEADTTSRNWGSTGPRGNTRSGSATTSRTEEGVEHNRTVERRNGTSVTTDRSASQNEDGSVTVDTQRAHSEGETVAKSRTYTPTEDGFETSATVTNPAGETAQRDVAVSHDGEGTVTREATTITFEGETFTSQQSGSISSETQQAE